MPQIGDSVQLYIPNHREEEAFVRSSLRQGGNSPKLGNPSVKYWGNPFGKELKFSGNELRMTAQENHVFMKLHDTEGIELHSKEAIVLHADREIALEAGRLDIRGKEAVYLLSGSSSIVLDGDTDIKGARLRIEGLTKAPVQVSTEPVGSESHSAGLNLNGSTSNNLSAQKLDVAQLALNMAGMVPVVGPVVAAVSKGNEKTSGKYESAALSVAASVPFSGWTGVGAKAAQTSLQAIKGGNENVGSLGKNSSFILGKVNTSARKLQSNHSREEVIERLKKYMQHKTAQHEFAGIPIYVRSRADAKPTTMDKILDIGDGLTIGGDQAISSFQNLLVEMGSDPIGVTSQMIDDKVTGILKFANDPVGSVLAVASNIKSTATHISQLYKDGNTKELASILGNEVASSILSKGFSKGLNKNGKSNSFKEGNNADKKGERTKGTPKAQTRADIMNTVQGTLSPAVQKIKELDPDAKVGYRGSLATGQKGPHKGNAPFDPTDFDIDAFIVSDKLAQTFPKRERWRSAREVSDDLSKLQDNLEQMFRDSLPGYRYEPKKPFTFRIFTEKEFNNKILDKGINFIE